MCHRGERREAVDSGGSAARRRIHTDSGSVCWHPPRRAYFAHTAYARSICSSELVFADLVVEFVERKHFHRTKFKKGSDAVYPSAYGVGPLAGCTRCAQTDTPHINVGRTERASHGARLAFDCAFHRRAACSHWPDCMHLVCECLKGHIDKIVCVECYHTISSLECPCTYIMCYTLCPYVRLF